MSENFNVISINDIESDNFNKKSRVIITFDDGYENISKIALDILDQFKQKATCFIVLNKIDINRL